MQLEKFTANSKNELREINSEFFVTVNKKNGQTIWFFLRNLFMNYDITRAERKNIIDSMEQGNYQGLW